MGGVGEKERGHERKGQHKHDIAQRAEFLFAGSLGLLVGQQVENHRRPAGIAAPAATEEQRPEDLGDGIMNGSRFKHAHVEIIPEALDLHILAADDAEIHQHIGADRELHEAAGVLFAADVHRQSHSDTGADVGKIEEIKEIVEREPERHRHGFKGEEQDERGKVLFEIFHAGARPFYWDFLYFYYTIPLFYPQLFFGEFQITAVSCKLR